MRTGSLVTGEHLQGRPVAGQSLGVGQQQLEAVTAAAGAGSLHVAVLVLDRGGGRGVVRTVSGRPDRNISELLTGLAICQVREGLQLDGSLRFDHTEELEVVAGVDIDTSCLGLLNMFLPSGVFLYLDTRGQWLPGSLRFRGIFSLLRFGLKKKTDFIFEVL